MHFSVSAAVTLALSTVVAANPTYGYGYGKPKPVPKPLGLNTAIIAKGRQFWGTALTIRNDTVERKIIDNFADFGSVTPENAMKWESTEPNRRNFTFAGADAVRDYAAKHKKQIHCHNLVWHSQLPPWVTDGKFDNKTLISIMSDHIKAVAGRYKGHCTRWDVVNEALNEDGTYRESVFYNTIGEAFLPIAFRIAHQVDPHAKLFYNDYNLEDAGPKALGARRIVKLIQSYGVKIDGVGLQAHLTSESTPTSEAVTPSLQTLEKALRLYTSLGLDVVYTELDVRLNTPTTPKKLKAQVAAYERVTKSCINVKKCIGITSWGVSDKYSWIPGVFTGEGDALIWDLELKKKKPIYDGILRVIKTTPWAWH